jgi:hypothetical protein
MSGFSSVGSKFLSIVRRARMVSARDNEIYTGSGLRGRPVCCSRVPDPGVLIVEVTSWSGEGVRSQVPGDGVRSYGGLTLVTIALLSLL